MNLDLKKEFIYAYVIMSEDLLEILGKLSLRSNNIQINPRFVDIIRIDFEILVRNYIDITYNNSEFQFTTNDEFFENISINDYISYINYNGYDILRYMIIKKYPAIILNDNDIYSIIDEYIDLLIES
tara:strand:+ start:9707 stop:10087 length:381 start_codon:yes stop_codon:yes gene_type:complete